MKKQLCSIYLADALRLLSDRRPHTLRLWKLSTGDILTYEGVTAIGEWKRGAMHRVRFNKSGQIRALRDISIFEIDGLSVYL